MDNQKEQIQYDQRPVNEAIYHAWIGDTLAAVKIMGIPFVRLDALERDKETAIREVGERIKHHLGLKTHLVYTMEVKASSIDDVINTYLAEGK